jgi:hypothetical protein
MSDPDSIRKFAYREPRMATGFNVDFVTGGPAFHGFCRDVSDAGIRAEFDDPIVVGDSGLLILRPPAGVLEVHAQVAYIEKRQVGLLFLFQTSWERRMTIGFIAAIAHDAGTSPAGRFP